MTRETAKLLMEKELSELGAKFDLPELTVNTSIEEESGEDGALASINGLLRIGAVGTESEIYAVAIATVEENGEVDDELFEAEMREIRSNCEIYKERLKSAENIAREVEAIDELIGLGIKAEIERAAKNSRGQTMRAALTAAAIMVVFAAICLLIKMIVH